MHPFPQQQQYPASGYPQQQQGFQQGFQQHTQQPHPNSQSINPRHIPNPPYPHQPPYLPPIQSSLPTGNMGAYTIPPMTSMALASPLSAGGSGPSYHTSQHPAHISPAGPSNQARPVRLTYSSHDDRFEYSLAVEQQPQRARMCGFGDKDRRPITPPPCVRLIIKDVKTGKEVDMNETDGAFFILQVDLWDEHGEREVNIVRASTAASAISLSSSTTPSFPPTPERTMMDYPHMHVQSNPNASAVHNPLYPRSGGTGQYPGLYMPAALPPQHMYAPSAQSSSPMLTRNLIGSLSVNASRLSDLDDKVGYWFVLQDLSVRTEGFFRLKMKFVDIGARNGGGLNRGVAACPAWVFSDKFQVYSAKKFPGVIESTPLSKRFATQGIKIPIRKDVRNDQDNDDDDDE